jgi:hypothetical protein
MLPGRWSNSHDNRVMGADSVKNIAEVDEAISMA